MPSPYLSLNPFLDTSVGEAELWGARDWVDVPEIHATQFAELMASVDTVRGNRRTKVRFVRGSGGSGKSHLFARLRRQYPDSIFYAYAPNPPLQSAALEGFVLNRVIASLRQPARLPGGGLAPYSQLRLLAYALIKPVIVQELPMHELHDAWAKIPLDDRKQLLHEAMLLLESNHPQTPRSVLRTLLTVLREDKENLAAQWLGGATYLTKEDLKYLGAPDALQKEEAGEVIQLLGRLSARVGMPFILILDQLDLISSQEQFDEFQRLLFSLIDQSENWLVLIGLVAERFTAWEGGIAQALLGRIGIPDSSISSGFRLPVTDVLPIGNGDKRTLLNSRLRSKDLEAQRAKEKATFSIHPLTVEEFGQLTSGGAISPRLVLAAASEAFIRCANALPDAAAVEAPPPAAAAVPVSTAAKAPAAAAAPPPAPPALPPAIAPAPPAAVASPPKPAPATAPAVPPAVAVPAAAPVTDKKPLAAKVDELVRAAMLSSNGETAAESAVDLGERVRDLIQLMAGMPVEIREGDMRKSLPSFDGSDYQASWGGGQVRVVTTDSVRNGFLAVLERLQPVQGGTLLLRHAVAPISGQLTTEKLAAFSQRNLFHHLPASESSVLAALGRVLAAMREGSYDNLPTEPPSTRQNILNALRQHPLLRSLKTWELIAKIAEPKSPLSAIIQGNGTPAAASAPMPPPPAVVAAMLPVATPAMAAPPAPAKPPAAAPAPIAKPPAPPTAARPPGPPPAKPAAPPPSMAKPAPPPPPISKPVQPPPPPAVAAGTAQKTMAPISKPMAKPVAKPIRPPLGRALPPPTAPK